MRIILSLTSTRIAANNLNMHRRGLPETRLHASVSKVAILLKPLSSSQTDPRRIGKVSDLRPRRNAPSFRLCRFVGSLSRSHLSPLHLHLLVKTLYVVSSASSSSLASARHSGPVTNPCQSLVSAQRETALAG